MAIPRRKTRGHSLLTAKELNAIRDAARAGANPLVGSRGLDILTAEGTVSIALSPKAVQYEDAIDAVFKTDISIGLYAVVEYYEAVERYRGPLLTWCRLPSESGFSRLGITLLGGQLDRVLPIQTRGICPIAYTGTVAVGDRLGGRKDIGNAQPDQGGPFRVLQIVDDESDPHIAVVEITGRRIDAKLVDADSIDPSLSGPYKTIIYRGFAVTQNSPGILTTT